VALAFSLDKNYAATGLFPIAAKYVILALKADFNH
jgi:hypothetical protein